MAFALQIRQNLGCNLFASLPYRFTTLHAKSCDALPTLLATIVLPDFARSSPAGKSAATPVKNQGTNQKHESKARKGTTEKRAREYGLQRGSFFLS